MQMWWISFVGACCLVITCAVSPPTTTNGTPIVPREFPNFNQNYTFVDNSSIRENLASHSDVDTEVEDLLAKDEDEQPVKQEGEEVVPNPPEQYEDVGKKSVVEWIENGEDTEDNKFGTEINQDVREPETKLKTETTTTKIEISGTKTETSTTERETTTTVQQTRTEKNTIESLEPYEDGVPVINGSVAAIFVGAFLVICIFGYTALILWRRSLEIKYGSREMLVEKDEIFDPDDMRHFSI